jgi:long-chain acyl-CoA synthetase
LGRRLDTINLGGIKVSPREVEEVLLKYKGILEAAVVGVKSEEAVTGEIIKAFLVVDDREKFRDLSGLKKFCLREIEAYKVPQEFEIISALPKTGSGKVKTHLLAEPREKKS